MWVEEEVKNISEQEEEHVLIHLASLYCTLLCSRYPRIQQGKSQHLCPQESSILVQNTTENWETGKAGNQESCRNLSRAMTRSNVQFGKLSLATVWRVAWRKARDIGREATKTAAQAGDEQGGGGEGEVDTHPGSSTGTACEGRSTTAVARGRGLKPSGLRLGN